jgi:hypothetical protein
MLPGGKLAGVRQETIQPSGVYDSLVRNGLTVSDPPFINAHRF